jgi:hypothetical protein
VGEVVVARKVFALLLGVVAVADVSAPSAGAASTKKFCAASDKETRQEAAKR